MKIKLLKLFLITSMFITLAHSSNSNNNIENSYLYKLITENKSKDNWFSLKLAIDLGASDLNVKDNLNRNLLQIELEKKTPNLKVIKVLINSGLNLENIKKSNNIKDTALYTALFSDLQYKNIIVDWLLKKGANPNVGGLTKAKLIFDEHTAMAKGFLMATEIDPENSTDLDRLADTIINLHQEAQTTLNYYSVKLILSLKNAFNNYKGIIKATSNTKNSKSLLIRSLYDLELLPILLTAKPEHLPTSKKYSQVWEFIINFNSLNPNELRDFIISKSKIYNQFKLLKLKKLLKLLRKNALKNYCCYTLPKIPVEISKEIIKFNPELNKPSNLVVKT